MKVDVLQVKYANFKRFRWWSDWVDIAVFDFECKPYLLQMRVSRTNKKQFNPICMTGFIYRQTSCREIGDLLQMEKRTDFHV